MNINKDNLTATLGMGSYFGEVALLKGCKRTATVISKNYSTCAEFNKTDFDSVLIRYSFVQQAMENHIQSKYNDKWRRFIHRALRNIDYLQEGIPNKIIDEIMYKLEFMTVSKDNYLFTTGQECPGIYIVSNGQLDMYLNNSSMETYLDTLYTGCSIGSYACPLKESFTTSCKAKTDVTVLKLSNENLNRLRKEHDVLDTIMTEYEAYVESNGAPFCDYKLYRYKSLNVGAKAKMMFGIHRINRIIKSYKTYAIQELFNRARADIKLRQSITESRRKTLILKRNPITSEQRTEQSIILLNLKVDGLTKQLEDQEQVIRQLKDDINVKLDKLLQCNGISVDDLKASKARPLSLAKAATSEKVFRLQTQQYPVVKRSRRKRQLHKKIKSCFIGGDAKRKSDF